ncbi:MAG: MlaD family protein [Jaaginema sp. PMC 1079.18]|nr:MlaD family protein [Jaaginema sp. PMC 1080.18]MEC4850723.1 MlaD family protein [Jaaginema sp. PMC 1079.18]MEC4867724.1 MlaD family protein [Jaaginema sp. PMC 1078.18]
MRSRAIREGSVGLLVLVALGLLGGITVWLRGLNVGRTSYSATVEFANANGMSIGAPVRYRGVNVGKIIAIEPGTNGIDVQLEISPVDLLIPKESVFQASQSGLISQTAIDIIPLESLSSQVQNLSPIGKECDSTIVVCDRDRLQGETGATIDDLLNSTVRLSDVYASPEFADNISRLLDTAEVTAENVSVLSQELQRLSQLMRQQLPRLTTTAQRTSTTLNTTALQIGDAANRAVVTLEGVGQSAQSLSGTATEFGNTAQSLNLLSDNVNRLVDENRASLSGTLVSVRDTSESLQDLLLAFGPTVDSLNTALDPAEIELLIDNLEELIANSSAASANLRDLTASFNNPELIVELQRTLNSARETFENTRKITSEVDELTGDPSFRENLRRLVNGLGNLLSSTQELEQQIQVAQALETYRDTIQELETAMAVARNLQEELKPDSQTPKVLLEEAAQPKSTPTWRKPQKVQVE